MAQLPILEGLFKNVSDVNLYGTLAWFADRPPALAGSLDNGEVRAGTLFGLGFEISFEVGEFSPRDSIASSQRSIDTVEVQQRQPDGSLLIYKPVAEQKADPDNRWLGELAIGYSELRDFESASPGLDIRGALRELPAVSLYFNHLPEGSDDEKVFSWYLGVRTGLAQLQGLRGYLGNLGDGIADQIYNGGGTTFQFGALVGAVIDFGSWNLFVEPGYTRRRFSSVEWGGINGNIADALPRSLDMSTWAISAGTQIEIGAAAKSK